MDFETRQRLRQQLRELLAPTVERLGCKLVAVELASDRGRRVLRLTIDRAGASAAGAVDIDDCARVSRAISPLLDVEDPLPGAYQLEVSSPGIDRPVQRPEDFRRFAGYRIRIRMAPGEPRRHYTGLLRGLDRGQVILEVDGQPHSLPLDRIDLARLQLDLDEFRRLGERPPGPDGGTP